jgi:pteridine reductase
MFSKFETNKSKEELTQKIPQKKTGQPQDILQAILYLAEAPYVTGQMLSVDGGRGITF